MLLLCCTLQASPTPCRVMVTSQTIMTREAVTQEGVFELQVLSHELVAWGLESSTAALNIHTVTFTAPRRT